MNIRIDGWREAHMDTSPCAKHESILVMTLLFVSVMTAVYVKRSFVTTIHNLNILSNLFLHPTNYYSHALLYYLYLSTSIYSVPKILYLRVQPSLIY